jgi:hypothetical protein
VKSLTEDKEMPVTRRRLSHLFGPDGRVLPYNFATALGAHALYALDRGKCGSENFG